MRSLTTPTMNNILREMVHVAVASTGDIYTPVVSEHIKGSINRTSDALSRNRIREGVSFLETEVIPSWIIDQNLPTNSVFQYVNLSQNIRLRERKLVTSFINQEL